MNKEASIALIHGYGLDRTTNFQTLDIFSRMQVLAAAVLLISDQAEQVVFNVGKINSNSPTVGQLMAEKLTALVPSIGEDAILVSPYGKNTRDEIMLFRGQAIKQCWKDVVFVANPAHTQRVCRYVDRYFGLPIKQKILTTDSILSDPDLPHWLRVLPEQVQDSELAQAFSQQERVLNLIGNLPLVGRLLEDRVLDLSQLLPNKIELQTKILGWN